MNNYLVTGGAGFIGSHIVDQLADREEQVTVIDNFYDNYNPGYKRRNISHHQDNTNVEIIEGDICNGDLLDEVFQQNDFDAILHIAAIPGVRPSIEDPMDYEHSNVKGQFSIYEKAVEYEVENIVDASSSSVYGNRKETPFSEEDRVDTQISPYAATKKSGEEISYVYHHLHDLNVVNLRFFTVYGERGRPDMAPWIFTENILTDQPIQQYGDGTSKRDYTYIDDIVSGVMASLDRVENFGYEIINLGRGEPVVLKDFIDLIQEVSGKEAEIEVLPEQPGDVEITHADISKAEELLDYNPQTSFEEGLENFVKWYRETFNITS